jgi:hypothetical protein
MPNTVCVTKLLNELKKGLGVLEEAMPAPHAGCSTSHGAKTVTVPIKSAGPNVGWCAQPNPKVASSSAAKLIPIA